MFVKLANLRYHDGNKIRHNSDMRTVPINIQPSSLASTRNRMDGRCETAVGEKLLFITTRHARLVSRVGKGSEEKWLKNE